MKRHAVLFLSLLIAAQAADAGYSQAGYVSNIRVDNDGVVLFDAETKASPACQSSTATRSWAFDSTNAAGQTKLALILSAYSLHQKLFIGGTSTCASRSDIEAPQFIATVDT